MRSKREGRGCWGMTGFVNQHKTRMPLSPLGIANPARRHRPWLVDLGVLTLFKPTESDKPTHVAKDRF